MSKIKSWQKWVMWLLPVYFLLSAGKELYICNVLAEAQGLSLNCIFQFWISEQKEAYEVLHVKALLRMQSALYMVLLSFVFAGWAFTSEYLNKKSSEAEAPSPHA